MQRIPSSRGRQNSSQSLLPEPRTRPPSVTSNKATISNGTHGTTVDVEKVAELAGEGPNDASTSLKETVNTNEGQINDEPRGSDDDIKGEPSLSNRGTDKAMRKDDIETNTVKGRQDRPRSISISAKGNGKTSKTSTPVQGSFTDSQRMRPSRSGDTTKRSHKKGAGLAAQLAAAAQGDDDDKTNNGEQRYCYCNQISYGEMVGCDNDDCPREWFHLDCVGLNKAPKGASKFAPSQYPFLIESLLTLLF